MNKERLILKGLLSDKGRRLKELELKSKSLLETVRFNTSPYAPMSRENLDKASQAMSDLKTIHEEVEKLREEIEKLNEDVG